MVMEIIISVVLLIVGIAFLIVIHLCVVGRAFRTGGDPINRTNSFPIQIDMIPSMNADDIRELPSFEYKVEEKGNGDLLECSVCLENFRTGENCRILPKCSHSFHAECIDSWLIMTAACPVCRTGARSPMFGQDFCSSSSNYSGELGGGELI